MNSAQEIVSTILETNFDKDEIVKKSARSYIDDILAEKTTATAEEMISHLNKFGLTTKQLEPLESGAGLELRLMKNRTLIFRRENEIPDVKDEL